MTRAFLLGALATLAIGAVVATLVVTSGVVDVSAANAGGLPDRILGYASTRSLAHHARSERNPRADDPAALKAGLEEYRAMCIVCHGAPGAEPEEFAAGLHPAAPDLASPEVQGFTDGMLYRAIEGGIGSTGMPAFGKTHRPDTIWSIVAFLRHLPKLTPEEKEALAGGEGEGAHAHAGEGEGEAHEGEAHEAAASAAPAKGGGRVHQVEMKGFKVIPDTLEVHVGDTVEWRNEDFAAHTATADDKTFDTGRIDGSESKRIVVEKKGRFPYYCRYHRGMKGTLVVE
jgi:plastocyanin/mono/diheme cytochrome c family protein